MLTCILVVDTLYLDAEVLFKMRKVDTVSPKVSISQVGIWVGKYYFLKRKKMEI